MEKSVKIKVSLSIIWVLLTMLIAGAASNSYSGFKFSSFLGGTVFFNFPIILYWLGFWIWGNGYVIRILPNTKKITTLPNNKKLKGFLLAFLVFFVLGGIVGNMDDYYGLLFSGLSERSQRNIEALLTLASFALVIYLSIRAYKWGSGEKKTTKLKQSNSLRNFFLLYDPHNKHPWKRYWARIFDYIIAGTILSFFIGLIDGLFSTNLLGAFDNQAVWSIFLVAVWALVESFLISYFSTTPGKWLLGIQVKNIEGQNLSILESMRRSGLVWKNGLAFGVPIIQLITFARSRNKLVYDGITSWDKQCGTSVLFNKSKTIFILIFLVIFLGITIWGKQQEIYERQFLAFSSAATKYPEERRGILESYLTKVVEILGNKINPVYLENECKTEASRLTTLPKGFELDCPTPRMFTNIKGQITKAKSLLENSNKRIVDTFVTYENDFYALKLPNSYTKSFITSYYQQKEETIRKLGNFFEVERDILYLYSRVFTFLESNKGKYVIENGQFIFDREVELVAYNKLIEDFNLLSEKEQQLLQELGT